MPKPVTSNALKRTLKKVTPEWLIFRARLLQASKTAAYQIINEYVDRNKNCIDVGAHRGVYTFLMARISRHVFAYEPDPVAFRSLTRNASRNTTLYNIAVSDVDGEATLTTPVYGGDIARGLGSLSKTFKDQKAVRFTVQTRTLDGQGHEDIGFIKIDVEGHEAAVLRGAKNILKTQRPILWIEIEQYHHTESIQTVFDLLDRLGYQGSFPWNGLMLDVADFSVEVHQTGEPYVADFLFLPQ